MCAKCVTVVTACFPEIPDDEIGGFLMNCTAFPCADAETIERQVHDLRAKTDDYRKCYGIVEAEMDAASKVDTEESSR